MIHWFSINFKDNKPEFNIYIRRDSKIQNFLLTLQKFLFGFMFY